MALVRILVDGDELLQQWQALAPGKDRFSDAAREELFNHLTQYFDASGTPLTILFDNLDIDYDNQDTGSEIDETLDVAVLYTRPGQTTLQMIHRLLPKFKARGPFLIVTDADMDPGFLQPLGGELCRCPDFIGRVKKAHDDMEREIARLNQTENQKFTFQG